MLDRVTLMIVAALVSLVRGDAVSPTYTTSKHNYLISGASAFAYKLKDSTRSVFLLSPSNLDSTACGKISRVPTIQSSLPKGSRHTKHVLQYSQPHGMQIPRHQCTFSAEYVDLPMPLSHGQEVGPLISAAASKIASKKVSQSGDDASNIFRASLLRRGLLGVSAAATFLTHPLAALAEDSEDSLRAEAYAAAFKRRDFGATQISELQPKQITELQLNPIWHETLGEVYNERKNFRGAVQQFSIALELLSETDGSTKARVLVGRALACEGLSRWTDALGDYDLALALAKQSEDNGKAAELSKQIAVLKSKMAS